MAELKRALGRPLLTLYGLGVMLGAGIYVLVGEVAGAAGTWAALSFILAAALAGLTAASYAELVGRFPVSAGEAVYVRRGFSRAWLAVLVGIGVMATGILSSAAMMRGFNGYFQELLAAPDWLVILGGLAILAAAAVWGVRESVGLAAVVTVIEAGGLVLAAAFAAPGAFGGSAPAAAQEAGGFSVIGLLGAGMLVFYAFIGFEDMVNVAEEAKHPERDMPWAIFLSLGAALVIYALIAFVATRAVAPTELAESAAPLALVFERSGGAAWLISLIAMFAVFNGALIQIIMASRVLYGLSREGLAPGAFGDVSESRRTPVLATLLVTVVVAVLALWGTVESLARNTSWVILLVFIVVNLALFALKRREPDTDGFRVPLWWPLLAAFASAAFVVFDLLRAL